MELGITAYSHIDPSQVSRNGKLLYDNKEDKDFSAYSKSVYKTFPERYAKFFKMDELCKLAYLGTEVLLKETKLKTENDGADIAIILGNRSSSLSSDKKHIESIKDRDDYFPSPAVFVYTLPNIMIGELCIRHQITGENSCFLMEEFKADFFYDYIKDLFENEGYKYCITGWVDYTEDHFESKLFLIEKVSSNSHYISKFKTDFDKIINTYE